MYTQTTRQHVKLKMATSMERGGGIYWFTNVCDKYG